MKDDVYSLVYDSVVMMDLNLMHDKKAPTVRDIGLIKVY